jgi:hypothetical protein
MTYLKWLLLLPVFFASTLVAYVLAPIAVLFRRGYSLRGTCFWWITTPNCDLRGDPDHQERWHHANSYLQFLTWVWRNPAVNFQRERLGVHVEPSDIRVEDGTWQYVKRGGKTMAWMYYLVKPYGATGKGLRVLLGWKVWDAHVKDPLQMTCRVTIWKTME